MFRYFIKSKKRGAALILEAIIALTVMALTASGLFYNNVSMYSGFDSYKTSVSAQMQAESKANEIKILSYTNIGTAASTRAAVSGTPFEREVIVGSETDLGGGNKKRDITINVYKPGESQPRASLPVTLTSQGSGVFGAYNVWNDSTWMKFHWSGQSGQPSWLWGGNTTSDMYIYNPSNFSVKYANDAGNANTLGGYTAEQLVSAAQSGTTAGNTVAILTGTIAHGGTIPLPAGFTQAQCKWMVSLNYASVPSEAYPYISRISCSVNANRVVTCQLFNYKENPSGDGGNSWSLYPFNATANYMIIGVK